VVSGQIESASDFTSLNEKILIKGYF